MTAPRPQGDAVRLAEGELTRDKKPPAGAAAGAAASSPAARASAPAVPMARPEPTADQIHTWERWWINLSEAIANEAAPGGENPRIVTKEQAGELGRHTARLFAGWLDVAHPLVAVGLYLVPGIARLALAKLKRAARDRASDSRAAPAPRQSLQGGGVRADGVRQDQPSERPTVGTFIES